MSVLTYIVYRSVDLYSYIDFTDRTELNATGIIIPCIKIATPHVHAELLLVNTVWLSGAPVGMGL